MNLQKQTEIKLKGFFPALTHKNFRYFWLGQCISLIGTWVQNTGQAWLVLTITDSPLLLGIVSALQFTPVLLFSLFAGVLVDRFSKKKLLIFTQVSLMILALSVTILVFTGKIKYWHILILAFLLGCINTIDLPARQSFMIDLVGKGDLINAIALNSSIVNGAKLIGPAVAGMLLHYVGFTLCFFINAITFIPVIHGILKIKVKEKSIDYSVKNNIFKDVKEGLVYIFKRSILYNVVILIAVIGTFAMNYNVLIPVYAKDVLNKGSQGFGFLMSAMGAGSLLGALTMAIKSEVKPKKSLLYISPLIISTILVVISFINHYYLSALLFFIIGFFNITFATSANSTLQLNSTDEYRGRVMSVYALVFNGVIPIGSLFAGSISNNKGVSTAFFLSGIIAGSLIVLIAFIFKRKSK